MVILDTSIIIDHLRQPYSKSLLAKIEKEHTRETLCLSILSVQELYEGQSTKNPEQEKDLIATITPLKILPYSYEIAKYAGRIMRDVSYPIEFADAAIAATAIVNGASLFTLDKKDFQGVKGLDLFLLPDKD